MNHKEFRQLIRESVSQALNEYVTRRELKSLENDLDRLYDNIGIDIEFTEHFVDRLNDPRNIKDIETEELKDLFQKMYNKYGQKLPNFRRGTNAVVNDLNSNINIPFTLVWNGEKFELVNKTIMRTKRFYSNDMKLRV